MSKDSWARYTDEGFKHYLVAAPGFKYNMMDLQAAIGIHQMVKFEKMQEARTKIWKRYDEAFKSLPLKIPAPPDNDTTHAHHLYTILCDLDKITVDRDRIQQALHKENIGTGIHFIAVPQHPYYRNTYGFTSGDFPNANQISDRTISLPLSAKLTAKDVDDVIEAVTKVFIRYQR